MEIETGTTDSNKKSSDNLDFLMLQYQVLSDSRINQNTLLWNVPSILFVAQAFLWTIALNSEIEMMVFRCGISVLSVIIAYVSFQTFERNRLMEVVDAEQLYAIEQYIKNLEGIPAMTIHHKLEERSLIAGKNKNVEEFISTHPYYKYHDRKRSLCQKSSAFLWKVIFVLTLIISCVILIYNILLIFGISFPDIIL